MTRRSIVSILALTFIPITGPVPGHAREVVNIVLHGRYFSEPATVRIVVDVEPDANNRVLLIEADSGELFRSSEQELSGADEKRMHTFVFKNLQAGQYMLRAEVRSASEVRGTATTEVVVTGGGAR